MRKAMLYKLGGFTAAVVATGALVATSVAATGAYFSDSENGSLQGKSGHLQLSIGQGVATNLAFNDLYPGQKAPQTITYDINATGGVTADVWLVFDKNSTQFADLTGKTGTGTGSEGGLGRYGYFGVAADGSQLFKSGNLSYIAEWTGNTYDGHLPYGPVSSAGSTCYVDQYGRGGTDYENTSTTMPPSGSAGPKCAIPDKILLAAGVGAGTTRSVDITLGVNIASTAQDSWVIKSGNVPFKIVAVQSGLGVAPSF